VILPLAAAQEAVLRGTRVKVVPTDISRGVDAVGDSALGCARRIESGYSAVGSSHEAVADKVRVLVVPRDRSGRVDAGGESALGCTLSIEGGYVAFGISHEAVEDIARTPVVPRDGTAALMLSPTVPPPAPVSAPGASNVVKAPPAART
jgi:hypothetical protein